MVRRLAFAVVLLAVCAASAFAQAPPPPPPTNPPQARDVLVKPRGGSARLRGVVRMPGGEPVKRATVTLSSGIAREQARTVTTDAEGRFAFQARPAGRFTLVASKPGYVSTGLGARRPGGPPRPVEVAEGADLDGANITLTRGCAISGRIRDEYGDPVSGVSLQVLSYRFSAGRRQLAPVVANDWPWTEPTDDLGQFRAYGLPAGNYYLSAVFQPDMVIQDEAPQSYAPTYYPGTPNPAEAAPVACQAGQEIRGMDFTLTSATTLTISGTVRNSTGKPVTSGAVALMPNIDGPAGFMGPMGSLQPDGTFTINEVPPGDYVIRTSSMGSTPAESETAMATVTLTRNLSGLSLVTGKPGVIRGRVVPDAGESFDAPLPPVGIVATSLDPLAPRSPFFGTAGTLQPDGSFEMRGAQGSYVFRVAVPNWALKAVHLHGGDVTDTPITFRADTDVGGVEIVLTRRLTSVTGSAVDADGKVVHDYAVLLFAQDPARWHWNSRFLFMARPDQQGRFKLPSVVPGAYYVAAVREADPEGWMDPESLASLKERAARVTLAEGDAKTMQLTILSDEKR